MKTSGEYHMKDYIEKLKDYQKGDLLFDYYESTIDLEDDRSNRKEYLEITLSKHDEKTVRANVYTRNKDDEEEKNVEYYLSINILDEVYKIVTDHKMIGWNNLSNPYSLDGKLYVCKFRYQGKLMRVSSDSMTSKGETAFSLILDTLSKAISKAKD
jgi:hypothetical protein